MSLEEQKQSQRIVADDVSQEYVSVTPADAWIGKILNERYEVVSLIGEGGMSLVYKANHRLLGKAVALKIISPSSRLDGETIRRFQQEAKASTALSHQNIVAVREFGQDDEGRPYLAMDLIEGSSLFDVIAAEGKLSSDRAIAIASQICAALDHAHEHGVVHRDIKPSNIILSKDRSGKEEVKILDFGIAKVLTPDGGNLTQTGEVFGSPNYMSPEQCRGERVDVRTDIYSLACVLYEMLHGTPPFVAASALEVLRMHIYIVPTPKQSNQLDNIILKALEKLPADRYASAQELQSDLASFSAGHAHAIVPSRQRITAGLVTGGVISLVVLIGACLCWSSLHTDTQRISLAVAVVLYFGSCINLLVNHFKNKL